MVSRIHDGQFTSHVTHSKVTLSKCQISSLLHHLYKTTERQRNKEASKKKKKKARHTSRRNWGWGFIWLPRKLAFEQIPLIWGKAIRERDTASLTKVNPAPFACFVSLCFVTGLTIAKTDLKLDTRPQPPECCNYRAPPLHLAYCPPHFLNFFLHIIAEGRRLQRKLACHRPCPLSSAPKEWLSRITKLRRPYSQNLKARLTPALGEDRKRCENNSEAGGCHHW